MQAHSGEGNRNWCMLCSQETYLYANNITDFSELRRVETNEQLNGYFKEVVTSLKLPGTNQVISILHIMLKRTIESMAAEVNKNCKENG